MNLPVTTRAEEWDEEEDWDEELELEDLPPEERRRVLRSIAKYLDEVEEQGLEPEPPVRRKRRRR